MIYASLKPIPAWAHRLVAPGYLLFALLTGGLLLAAIATLDGASLGNAPAMLAVWLAIALWLLSGATGTTSTCRCRQRVAMRSACQGVRSACSSGRTRKPITSLAKWPSSSRARIRAGCACSRCCCSRCVPILSMLPVWLFVHLDAGPWFALAAISALAGAFVERWLFFAEAKHMVTLYY